MLKNLTARVLDIPVSAIKKFKIINGDITPENMGGKFCHLDINMEVNAQRVNLEVQVEDEGDYPARSLYYWARGYSGTLVEGDNYSDLPRTIVINIVAFKLFDDFAGFHSEFRALEVTRHTELTDKMSLHYFELPKLPKLTEADIGDGLKMWLALFNAKTDEDLFNIKKIGGEIMGQAVMAYESVVASADFREIERQRDLTRLNETSALNNARRKGRQEGRQEGAQEVFALLEKGYSLDEAKKKLRLV